MSINIEAVETKECKMQYFRFGTGKIPLVIIPGLSVQSVMGAADAVATAYESMAEKFTIYLFDRRQDLPNPYSIYDMAKDTADALKTLGLKDVCLFGASQGGMISLVIAIEYPELVGKLVIGSSSAHIKEEQFKVIDNWINLARNKDKTGLYLAFGKELYQPEVFEQYRDYFVTTAETVTDAELERFIILASAIKGFDVTDKMDRIKCPTFVLGDVEDRVLDSDATMEMAEKLDNNPNFRLYMYNGYGHAAYDTAPDYRAKLLDFLTK